MVQASPYSAWHVLKAHTELTELLRGLKEPVRDDLPPPLEALQTIRMMGTFFGAVKERPAREVQTTGPKVTGLVEQTVDLIERHAPVFRHAVLIGSANPALPMSEPSSRFHTYLFATEVVIQLMDRLIRVGNAAAGVLKFDLKFTFVPEDVLFAQFYYDDAILISAASYSFDTTAEIQGGAYAAMCLDNRCSPTGVVAGPARRFPRVSERLIGIFDARFRQQAETYGQELWSFRRLPSETHRFGLMVETPFWRLTSSTIQPIDFTTVQAPQRFEVGPVTLTQIRKELRRITRREDESET